MTDTDTDTVHVCVATGQNAANFIPLQQYDAREILIMQTPSMQASASNLELALRRNGRRIERVALDDSCPAALSRSAEAIAMRLDGRHVVLHTTGGTKLMILALSDKLRLVEAGSGRLDLLYADTIKQQVDWLGETPRSDPMLPVLNVNTLLLVQGYRVKSDGRHQATLKRAQQPKRAKLTRQLGENAQHYKRFLSALAHLALRAAEGGASDSALTQFLDFAPGGPSAKLLQSATESGMLRWDGDVALTFASKETAAYFGGGWIEEFVLLKLSGGLADTECFNTNLQVFSADKKVPNELDAIVVHGNRALLIECKTGKQERAASALYKLAQLRDRLGGSVASAVYLSAQRVGDEDRQRAAEYDIQVLCAEEIGNLVDWLRVWKGKVSSASG